MARRLSFFGTATPTGARGVAFCLLAVLVVVVHGCVGERVANAIADMTTAQSNAPRIEVAFVREMALSAPPPTAAAALPPAPEPPRAPRRRIKPPRAASAPEPAPEPAPARTADSASDATAGFAAAASDVPDAVVAAASEPAADASTSPASAPDAASAAVEPGSSPRFAAPAASSSDRGTVSAGTAPASPSASAALAAFDWPVSTRVSFQLNGYYRGDVTGSAKVEWVRVGSHYQVHLDMLVGPSFAPVITRRMTSDGEITADGLSPHRYDEETRVLGRDRPPVTLTFEPDSVILADGERRDRIPGLQDTASQFVQLTYVFGTRPGLLRIGGTVDIPLALRHKVDVWTYDVVAEEILQTPFGDLPTIHLKPRRKSDRADELTAEIWFAPQLRYLPVRIRLEQGGSNYLDLLIDRRPEMAGS